METTRSHRVAESELLRVYVISLRQPLPRKDAGKGLRSGWGMKNLKPIQAIRRSAHCVYPGEEFIQDGHYLREWAVLTTWRFEEIQRHLDLDIFSVRKITSTEKFDAKYQDLLLHPTLVEEFKMGEL